VYQHIVGDIMNFKSAMLLIFIALIAIIGFVTADSVSNKTSDSVSGKIDIDNVIESSTSSYVQLTGTGSKQVTVPPEDQFVQTGTYTIASGPKAGQTVPKGYLGISNLSIDIDNVIESTTGSYVQLTGTGSKQVTVPTGDQFVQTGTYTIASGPKAGQTVPKGYLGISN
jgi:hypothetical protein